MCRNQIAVAVFGALFGVASVANAGGVIPINVVYEGAKPTAAVKRDSEARILKLASDGGRHTVKLNPITKMNDDGDGGEPPPPPPPEKEITITITITGSDSGEDEGEFADAFQTHIQLNDDDDAEYEVDASESDHGNDEDGHELFDDLAKLIGITNTYMRKHNE